MSRFRAKLDDIQRFTIHARLTERVYARDIGTIRVHLLQDFGQLVIVMMPELERSYRWEQWNEHRQHQQTFHSELQVTRNRRGARAGASGAAPALTSRVVTSTHPGYGFLSRIHTGIHGWNHVDQNSRILTVNEVDYKEQPVLLYNTRIGCTAVVELKGWFDWGHGAEGSGV